MSVRLIEKDGNLLARFIPGGAWGEGLSFYSNDEEYVQVGTWVYNEGKALSPHIHNEVERKVSRTQEVIYVRKGSIEACIYGVDGELVSSVQVSTGDTLVLLIGGHGYKVLEDGTQVLEVKSGPYVGASLDRRRF